MHGCSPTELGAGVGVVAAGVAEDEAHGEEHPPFAYVPFGGGARLCLGMTFALQEMKVVLSALLAHWRLTLEPGQRVVPRPVVTLVPRAPILMHAEAA